MASFVKDKVASPYISIANGSLCVVPSLKRIVFLFTKSLDGLEFEFYIASKVVTRKRKFFRTGNPKSFQLRKCY